MDKESMEAKLNDLKDKQEQLDKAWKETGNKELLQFFVDIIPKVIDVERCSIFVVNPKEENIWLQCGTGLQEKSVSVPAGSSIVGQVISTGEHIVEENMQEQLGAHDIIAVQTSFVPRNVLCVPVHGVSTDRVTGAIQALNKRRNEAFTDDDRVLLEKLAYLLQTNIENIFLRQQLGKLSEDMRSKIEMLEIKLMTMP